MSSHLILQPAPEAEWAELPASEHEKGMRSHGQFHEDLKAGGHTEADLRAACQRFAARGEHIEFRRMAE